MQKRVEIKPLSVNQAWKGRRFKTDKYKQFEHDLYFILPNKRPEISDMIRVELFFGFSSVLSDLDNPIKMVLDVLQKKYSFNDRDIFELNVRKCIVESGKDFIDIGIYPLLPFEK